MDGLCLDDVDAFGAELDDPIAEFEQDVYHRLLEAPGSNPDDIDRGLGLRNALSSVADGSLKHRIESEILKDDRATGVNATVTLEDGGGNAGQQLRIEIDIEPEGSLAILLDASTGEARRVA